MRVSKPGAKLPTEHEIQAAFFNHVDSKYAGSNISVLTFAVPNGGHRHIKTALKLKKEGVKRGVSDVLCLIPVKPYHGLVIEFKRHPNKPTKEQLEFMTACVGQRYKVGVCYSVEDAITLFEDYLFPRLSAFKKS